MTFEQIDRALTDWNQRLAAIADNLLQLQGDSTYRVLTGSGGVARLPLYGQTAIRILPALAAMETIFQHFSLLQTAIERASQLRKDMRAVFGREQVLRQIQAELEGESIPLPEALVALEQRTLLSGVQGDRRVRPEALLALMTANYIRARDAVLTVSGAWEDLATEMEAIEQRIARAQQEARSAGFAPPWELEKARTLLDAVKDKVQCDPLTALAELRVQAQPAIAAAERQMAERMQFQQQLVSAGRALRHLQDLERETCEAIAQSAGKIANCDGEAVPGTGEFDRLHVWLQRLEQRSDTERLDTLLLGLRNWQRAAERVIALGEERLRLSRLPLETRSELRGRLDALKAKARVYGVSEQTVLAQLAGSAEVLLYTQPTDLSRSAVAVETYERMLSGAGLARRAQVGTREDRR